jgi:hypothetical protein
LYRGTFEPPFTKLPEKDASLRGAGTLEITPGGLRVAAKRVNDSLANALAIALAIALGLVVIVGFAIVDDMTGAGLSLRLGAVLGVVALFGGYVGGRMLVEKIFPGQPIEHVLPLTQIAGAEIHGELITLVSRDPGLTGAIAFRTPTAAALAAALDEARSRNPRS